MTMPGFSTPSEEVQGPHDLVARMNEATSEEWEKVPLPARQQLGWHGEPGDIDARSGNGIQDYLGEDPENLVHSLKQTETGVDLTRAVTYHLEETPPPAEPAGAPGSAGYNEINRHVPAADGFEVEGVRYVEQTSGGRVVRFKEGNALEPDEQAKVDGVGPHAPGPNMLDESFTAAENENQTPRAPDPDDVEQADLGVAERYQGGGGAGGDQAAAPTSDASADGGDGTDAGNDAQPDQSGGDLRSQVPDGSMAVVLSWVGDDKARARAALEEEQSKSAPRQTLIGQLNERI
jgi:hypothetical protein